MAMDSKHLAARKHTDTHTSHSSGVATRFGREPLEGTTGLLKGQTSQLLMIDDSNPNTHIGKMANYE